MKLSIVIPCYNEAEIIQTTADEVLQYMTKFYPQITHELILVNDGSKDRTGTLLQEMAQKNSKIVAIGFPNNLGRGAAIKAGIAQSTGEWIALLDADLSYDVEHLGKIIDSFTADHRLDVVVISPYMKGGHVSGVPATRLLLSKTANWILAGFFEDNLSTVTCVVRGYRGSVIRHLPLFENGKELHLEILRKCAIAGAKILEVPGRLVWKEAKLRATRKGVRVFSSGMKHIWWGMLIKPTRIVKYLAMFFLAVGIYETMTLAWTFFHVFESSDRFWLSVWSALSATFAQSPHTVVIASISLIMALQSIFFIILFQVLKLQQEESMRHTLALWARLPKTPKEF